MAWMAGWVTPQDVLGLAPALLLLTLALAFRGPFPAAPPPKEPLIQGTLIGLVGKIWAKI